MVMGFGSWLSVIAVTILVASVVFIIMKRRKNRILNQMPEEKELLQLKKREKIERKAISKMKSEQKLKEEISREKRKISMRLAVDEAQLSEINREGLADRKRESDRYDKKNSNEEGFY